MMAALKVREKIGRVTEVERQASTCTLCLNHPAIAVSHGGKRQTTDPRGGEVKGEPQARAGGEKQIIASGPR
jgi:hypothetical protein